MIEETAITSADPVDITAIKIRNNIAYSPVIIVAVDQVVIINRTN